MRPIPESHLEILCGNDPQEGYGEAIPFHMVMEVCVQFYTGLYLLYLWCSPFFGACVKNPTSVSLSARLLGNSPRFGGSDLGRGLKLTLKG